MIVCAAFLRRGRACTRPSPGTLCNDAHKCRPCLEQNSRHHSDGVPGLWKSTLLNRILTAEHGRRVAVIINEFGQVGIDHHLLISSDQHVVEMNNGCVCCTVRGDLVRSFFELLGHRDQFDIVVIETTGLAEPAPVAQSIYADERIRKEFALSGTVTVVDAKYIAKRLEDQRKLVSKSRLRT